MNVKELLDTDVDVLGGWVREGFAWWREEISQLAPQRWRDRLKPRVNAIAWTDGTRLELRDASGRRLADADKVRRVAVVLAPALYLVRRLELPSMRLGDVRKLVENEIDRLTPFRKEDVWYDIQVESRNDAAGTQSVAIGLLPRDRADGVRNLIEQAGLEAESLQTSDAVHFDFLPGMRAGVGQGLLRPRTLWIAVAVLFLLNIALFIVRDVHRLNTLREMTASQGPVVELARRLREKVDAETAARTQLLRDRARTAPLPILADVTSALPADAWVQKMDWDGRVLHLSGYAAPTRDMGAVFAKLSPRTKTNLSSAVVASGANRAFDVTIEIPARGGP